MAVNKNKPSIAHLVGAGATGLVVEVPDNYSAIGNIVGVNKLTADAPDGADGSTIGEAIKNGKIIRVKISFKDGTKRKTADIICQLEKAKTALNSLKGKTYGGFTIISAYLPRRARFS